MCMYNVILISNIYSFNCIDKLLYDHNIPEDRNIPHWTVYNLSYSDGYGEHIMNTFYDQ